jgi:hypothetical protein
LGRRFLRPPEAAARKEWIRKRKMLRILEIKKTLNTDLKLPFLILKIRKEFPSIGGAY